MSLSRMIQSRDGFVANFLVSIKMKVLKMFEISLLN